MVKHLTRYLILFIRKRVIHKQPHLVPAAKSDERPFDETSFFSETRRCTMKPFYQKLVSSQHLMFATAHQFRVANGPHFEAQTRSWPDIDFWNPI